jgi:hypothetical protein
MLPDFRHGLSSSPAQNTGFVASLLALLGYEGFAAPDYSMLCRRQSSLSVAVVRL